MDPLYANYDKRKKTLEENSAPVPQPTSNSMPVFGAAAAPAPAQMPATAPAESPAPAPAPTPTPAPMSEPTPAPTPVQEPVTPSPEPVVPAPTSFEQQFEQMVNGAAPAKPTQPQQQFNPNYTGTGDIILNLDQPKKKLNIKIVIAIVAILGVAIFAIIMIALRAPRTTSQGNDKQAVKNFIEYFVFGTEGANEVTDEIMNSDPEKFAFTYNAKNDNYTKNLTAKIDKLKNNEDLKKQLETYFEVSKILDMNYMLKKYVNKDQVEEDGYGISDISSIVKKYETDTFEYYKALDDNGCIDSNGEKDNECIREYSDEVKEELINSEKWHSALREQKKNIAENIAKSVRELW